MRLIHTSDIHLDHSFAPHAFPPRLGTRRRQAMRHVFRKILDRAVSWPADAVLIAGDLFDQEYVARDTVVFLHEMLSRVAPIPVFIAPGNRDPLVAESPYAVEAWPEHVHIFREPHWSTMDVDPLRLVVHGFAFDGREISCNPFDAFDVPDDGRTHVAVCHASEVSLLPEGQKIYCPFQAEDHVPGHLSYLALGHYHDPIRLSLPQGGVLAYPGTPEAISFQHSGVGQYFEVEVSESGVAVVPVAVGETVFLALSVNCTGLPDAQSLIDTVRGIDAGQDVSMVLRLTLEGVCDAGIWSEMESVREALQNQFEHVELVDQTEPLEDFDVLGRENTSLGSFATKIADELRVTPPGARQQMLLRARDAGLAAFRGWDLPVRGLGRE